MAYYPGSGGQLLLFGGDDNNVARNDTYNWTGTNWVQVADSSDAGCATTCTASPPVRWDSSFAYDPVGAQMVLFAGYSGSGALDDTWAWKAGSWAQLNPANQPPAVWEAAFAYDTATSQLLLYGGWNGTSYSGNTWAWTGTTWASSPPRPARQGATRAWPTTPPRARWSSTVASTAATSPTPG